MVLNANASVVLLISLSILVFTNNFNNDRGRVLAFGTIASIRSTNPSISWPSPHRATRTVALNDLPLFASKGDIHEAIVTRRDASYFLGSTAVALALFSPYAAYASGGATAGGAYLLSAKQRYNKRVTAGLKSFISLSSSLESGSLEATKSFFAGEDEGSWKDTATAGYLLANAFRKSSATPPDSLPAVKKWKAFKASVGEVYSAAVTKNNLKETTAAYANAQKSLDDYLEAVELPSSMELK
mmetsp:Transcript_22273/g.31907  ORF Transcript_22273/g.31907 Transcript_22273/m.31907 type:complete len:242 (+) Transcript_22273:134-859(+)|eukprot:CAMPEP_0172435912 /NCGR_PEP_ID=MMETSP1064-20121228/71445_1 /TAXON_ID=202472 /ORGANISM="Aulacoseira subarctica , Strain CCAP 1002/5" /LENGTH=241 /DNA_ID=CAMNT_0013184281 /DNA_START=72 /DNA_END=797 /DNA_ORIENTATION=-